MSEENKSALESTPSIEVLDEKKVEPVAPLSPTNKDIAEPNEAFFGTLLIGCLALSVIAAMGYFGFAGYRYFKAVKNEKAIPSITLLPAVETEKEATPAVSDGGESSTDSALVAKTSDLDKKTLEIKVLNGGTAKGVAGTYAEKLKKEGFTKTTVGNTVGNFTGATLYYAKGQEANLTALKAVILKDYPALIVKEAESGNKDTLAAPLALILGR